MHRLFVAIRPPRPIREQLLGLMEGVQGVRWQDDDQLHLTLAFVGEVDRHQAEDIAAALGNVRHGPFEIRLDGIGTFDRRERLSAIWAGVRPHDDLKSLRRTVKSALRSVGVEPEKRAYLPHITIARANISTGPIEGFVSAHGGLASEFFHVDHFALFESHLGRQGARYEIVERYPLGR